MFVARQGLHELTSLILTSEQVRELVERMLSSSGRRLDVSQPFVDAMLPGGHRLHVVLDGISRGFAAVNVRKFVAKAHSLADLVELGTLDTPAATFLDASVRAGLNVIVSGGTQAGKTTLLNCLAASIPGSQRLISAEEVFELQTGHPDWVAMQTRQAGLEGTGQIDLRVLVKEALRMRPSRLIIGEVRAAECLDLLLALNAGLPGMASLHANSARQALVKLCTLPLLAGDNIGSATIHMRHLEGEQAGSDLSQDLRGPRRTTPGRRQATGRLPGPGRTVGLERRRDLRGQQCQRVLGQTAARLPIDARRDQGQTGGRRCGLAHRSTPPEYP